MYTLRLVDRALRCSLCRSEVAGGGLAGHYYEQPLCRACFAEAEPRVARAWMASEGFSGESLREVRDPEARCGSCDQPLGSWVAGFSGRQALCRECFARKAPPLAAILILDAGARDWKGRRGEAAEIALLAGEYAGFVEGT